MNKIIFPLLNLELNINKIAFNILGIEVYWYAVLIVASLILAMFFLKKQNGRYGIMYEDILDLSIILIPISFICARIYYIVFNIKNYKSILQMLNIKDGGLAIYGGIIGGVITIYFFCKKRNIQLLNLTDNIVPYLALGQSIGRWGNFINVEAYGSKTNLPWKMGIMVNGNLEYVHPTFLYESILDFVIYLILIKISKNRKYEGQLTYYYLLMYSFIRAIIESLRIDSLMLGNLKVSQILSIIIFMYALYKIIEIRAKMCYNKSIDAVKIMNK